jgi:uncharacterized membrane protein
MPSGFGLLLIFGIGVTTGLRCMTAPAVVAWAAHLGWINLSGSPLAFMSSVWAVALFTLSALTEYVVDQLPSTPPRTSARGLTVRIVMGMLTGACLGLGEGALLWVAALIGAIGAVAGAFGGYQARVRLVRGLHVPDAAVAIPEDLVAVGLGLLCCFEIPKLHAAVATVLVPVLAHMQSRA